MSWKKELEELKRRKDFAKDLGGNEKIKRQHKAGRLTIRERIKYFFDNNTFHEIGALSGKATYDANNKLIGIMPSNSVIGRGLVNQKSIIFYGDDFTVRGGASDAAIWEKMILAEQFHPQIR